MIVSKVIFDNGRHITSADYGDQRPMLDSINVIFPRTNSLQARSLCRCLKGMMLTHRDFDSATRSYRLGSFVWSLRHKGWAFINHDETGPTQDVVPRNATYTRYELYAKFTPELQERIKAFCKAVDDFEARGRDAAKP
ncbi:MAG: hypothetical protein ACXWEO_02780 [Methylobacter sp.]